MNAAEILEAMIAECDPTMIWASELALSSGARRCDFWTLAPCQSKGYAATAYEIKVSRADYRRDTPEKQREARLFSDRFYYVTPPALIQPAEVPDWAGLIEIVYLSQLRVAAEHLTREGKQPWQYGINL
jgi:hypothetical protein